MGERPRQELLLERLRSANEETRERALEQLWHGDPTVRVALRPELLRMLESPLVSERYMAALALDPGAGTPAVLEVLLDMLRMAEQPRTRWMALGRVGELGPPPQAVPQVLEALRTDEQELLRMGAADVLAALAPTHPEVAEALFLALKDVSVGVRSSASGALSRRGPATAALVPRMLAALEDPELEDIRGTLGFILAKLGARAVVPRLVHLLEQPDEPSADFDEFSKELWGGPSSHLKGAAAQALGELGPLAVAAVPVLLASLREGAGRLLFEAARALASIGTARSELEERLCTLLPGARNLLREVLLDVLAQVQPERDASLRELVRALGATEQRNLRKARTRILRAVGERPDLIERIQAFTRDEDPALRSAASEALGILGRPTEEGLKQLARRLESSEKEERASAIGELRTLGSRAGALLPWLTRQLPQLGAEARAAVFSVLGPLGGGRLDETLREALSAGLGDGEPRVREAATWALCDFAEDDTETLRLAQARLEDPEQAVREAAQAVLKTRAGAHMQEPPRREASPSAQAAGAIRALASRCYAALRAGEGNRVFSPLSLFMLLAMVLRGTRSHTEAALRQALHWPWEPASVAGALRGLFEQLLVPPPQQSGAPREEEDEGDALVSANGLFAQGGYLREQYLAELAESFGVAVQVMDFARAPEAAIAAINAWARQQTHGHIPVLVPPGGLSPDNRYVLANAVYFRSRWEEPFDKEDTSEEPFSLLNGQQVDVPMMQRKGTYGYASGPGYQSIELPYRGGQTSMIVLLPETGFFERFERLLTAERLTELLEGMSPEEFVLKLPRFSLEQCVELSALAEPLGVSALLAPDADLSGLTQSRERFRGALRHDTRLRVDEEGTVAASISSLFISIGKPREVEVNRPFLFLIRHRASNTVLFLGRVVDPR